MIVTLWMNGFPSLTGMTWDSTQVFHKGDTVTLICLLHKLWMSSVPHPIIKDFLNKTGENQSRVY